MVEAFSVSFSCDKYTSSLLTNISVKTIEWSQLDSNGTLMYHTVINHQEDLLLPMQFITKVQLASLWYRNRWPFNRHRRRLNMDK